MDWNVRQESRSEVLLQREGVGVLLDTIAAFLSLTAGDTSLCVLGNFLLKEVGLR